MSFESGVAPWIAGLGRLRDAVRQELVAAQLAEFAGPTPRTVLDVGCGQGTQAVRLARAGHTVVGLDPSAELLDRFRTILDGEPDAVRRRVRLVGGHGEDAPDLLDERFDLVLCHGVLMYLEDPAPILTALTAVAAPGTTLSLLVRNGLAPAMRSGLLGDWATAAAVFDTPHYLNRLGLPARGHTPAELDEVLAPLGWRRAAWFGVRVFTDHRDEPAPAPEQLAAIVGAEAEAGRRDPYRSVAALLHIVHRRDLTAVAAASPPPGRR